MTKAPASKSQSPLSIFDRPLGEPLGWLRTEIDRLFDDFGRPTRSVFNFGQRGLAPVPALDMVDDEKAYRLTAELPGLAEKDIDISVADGVLRKTGRASCRESVCQYVLILVVAVSVKIQYDRA